MASNNKSDCAQARALLGPDAGPSESTSETRDARHHVEHCQDCQSLYAQHRSVADRLRVISNSQKSPGDLRAKVLAAINREETVAPSRTIKRFARWPVLGGLVAAAAALAIWIGGDPQTGLTGSAVAAAMQNAPTRDSMVTTESGSLQDWFRTHSIPVFEIPMIENAQLTGGRVIQLAGRQSAAVDFIKDGLQLTYVMAPVSEWLEELSIKDIMMLRSHGHEVALWEEDGTARAVLSPMPRRQLLEIAEQCKNKRIL